MKAMTMLLLLLALALPAWADDAVTIPGELTTITFGENAAVTVPAAGAAWYKVYVEGSGNLNLALRGEGAAAVAMDIYRESGEKLGSGTAADGAVTAQVDANRDYWFFIRLTSVGSAPAALTLHTALAEPGPEFTVPADAAALAFDARTEGTVTAGGERWYTLAVPAGAAGDYLVIDLEGRTDNLDLDLVMTDVDGRVLAKSESTRPHERATAQVPDNRQVAVRVYVYRAPDAAGPAGDAAYVLRAYTAAEQPSATYAPNLPAEFTAVEPGQAVDGSASGAPQWYRYHIEERGNLRVAFSGEGCEVALFVEDGTEVFSGTAGAEELRLRGDANRFTDFYLRVGGRGDFAFRGELVTGDFVELPRSYSSIRPGQDVYGALREEIWFRFVAPQTGYALFAFDSTADTESDIDIALVNPEGMVLAKAETTKAREALLLDVEQGQTYFVRVYPYRQLERAAEFVLWVQTLERKLPQ